jgi:CubicO group peptidase (beta-lactamase class C family)
MRELVLDPLGMAGSSFTQSFPADRGRAVARGHLPDGTPYRGGWRVFAELASGGLWSTPADLARVACEILRAANGAGALLDRDLAAQLLAPADRNGYGLGAFTRTMGGVTWFGHSGDRHTYQCFSATDLENGNGMVVMANTGGVAFTRDLLGALDFGVREAIVDPA